MTRSEWAVLAETITERWPDRPRSAEWVAAWWPTVAGLEFGAAVAALEVYGREGNGFPPDGGQLARIAGEVVDPDGWDTAWAEVGRQIRRVGYLGQPEFTDQALAEAVASFGWRALCAVEEDQLQTARAQLRDLYRAARQRGRRREGLEALPAGAHRDAVASVVSGIASSAAIGGGGAS
ncbi:MAG: hypothetical protein AB7G65_19875 [Thermoleophilia bacterium]